MTRGKKCLRKATAFFYASSGMFRALRMKRILNIKKQSESIARRTAFPAWKYYFSGDEARDSEI
jgi:hypothetical protein